jgi:hypothetical protein
MLKKILLLVLFLVLIGNQAKAGVSETNKILIDTTKPVIIHTPIGSTPITSWPVSVNAIVTDSSGLDSVWVRWYKNTTSNYKRFKLLNTSGNNYSANFNSSQSDVVPGDVIYYRIIAQDNSPNHKKDSTVLYNFSIINLIYCIFGNGSDTSYYPFSTSLQDGRTQMLFLNSEITPCAGTFFWITRIGFYFISSSSQIIYNLNIRFQHTYLNELTGFANSGWTTVYSGSYSVQGNGIQYIDMPMPQFIYGSQYNLLVEICYNNTTSSTNSLVKSSYFPGKTWSNAADNESGCSLTGGTARNNRPNFYLHYIPAGSVRNNGIITNDYKLYQNYPNPFNPVTRIDFEIPKKGFVSLKVFDILGREVKSLVNENLQQGSFSVDFNAAELSSGIYFYKIETDGYAEVKKMILFK